MYSLAVLCPFVAATPLFYFSYLPTHTLTLTHTHSALYSKEGYLDSLNDFIDEKQEPLRDFFYRLCDVDDFYYDHKLETITSLATLERQLSITPNEVYAIHKLLDRYAHSMGLQLSDNLLCILKDLGEAPAPLSRKDNCLIELKLCSRWERNVPADSFRSKKKGVIRLEGKSIGGCFLAPLVLTARPRTHPSSLFISLTHFAHKNSQSSSQEGPRKAHS
jgi:hypothetical protein